MITRFVQTCERTAFFIRFELFFIFFIRVFTEFIKILRLYSTKKSFMDGVL